MLSFSKPLSSFLCRVASSRWGEYRSSAGDRVCFPMLLFRSLDSLLLLSHLCVFTGHCPRWICWLMEWLLGFCPRVSMACFWPQLLQSWGLYFHSLHLLTLGLLICLALGVGKEGGWNFEMSSTSLLSLGKPSVFSDHCFLRLPETRCLPAVLGVPLRHRWAFSERLCLLFAEIMQFLFYSLSPSLFPLPHPARTHKIWPREVGR